MSDSSSSAPLRLIVRLLLNIAVVWILPIILPSYVAIQGGWAAIILIGITMTLLNVLARPIIHILTFPLKLFMTIIAIILANAAFLWLLTWLIGMMDQSLVGLAIMGGLTGWIVVSLIMGLANWAMREMLK